MKLDENEVYWIDKNTAVMIHLANEPTGLRNHEGHLIDNIVDKGWYVFKGEPGKMIPTSKLSEYEAREMVKG